jgi:hypothetical protein
MKLRRLKHESRPTGTEARRAAWKEIRKITIQITGAIVKDLGYRHGPWWKDAIGDARGREFELTDARTYLDGFARAVVAPSAPGSRPWFSNIEADDDFERANIAAMRPA